MRRDLKVKKWIEVAGSIMAFLGLSGMAGGAEGEGDLILAIVIFVIGFSIVLWGYQR